MVPRRKGPFSLNSQLVPETLGSVQRLTLVSQIETKVVCLTAQRVCLSAKYCGTRWGDHRCR